MIKYVLLFIFIFANQVRAESCANMQIQSGQTNLDLGSANPYQTLFTVKADTRDGVCNFFIVFDNGLALSYTSRTLKMLPYTWPFQVYKDSGLSNPIKNISNASTTNDILNGAFTTLSNDSQVSVPYWAALNVTNPWLRFGNYSETLTATLYKGTLSSYSFVGTRSISFNYNAPKRTDIAITSTGGTFDINDTTETMNFGALTSGASKSADILVKYNAGYTLYASSTNNSRLKHQTDALYIAYTVKFNGSTVNLGSSASSPVQIARVFGTSPASGSVIPVNVTIGTFGTMKSGIYGDTIQLTVQSTE